MQINYQGQVYKPDFAKAIKLHNGRIVLVQKIIFGLFMFLFTISILIGIIYSPGSLPLPYVIAMFIPLVFLTLPWWNEYMQINMYQSSANIYKEEISGIIDEKGFTINSVKMKVNYLWDAIIKIQKTDDIVLLYQSKNCFNILTRSLFASEEEWSQLVAFLDDRFSKTIK